MTTAPTQTVGQINTKKIADLEARMVLVEKQIQALILQTKKLAKIDDQPPSVEGAYALKRICATGRVLGTKFLNNYPDPAVQEACGEILSMLDAIGQ